MFQPSQRAVDDVHREFGLAAAEPLDDRKVVWLAFLDLAEFLIHHTPENAAQRKALRLLLHARSAAIGALAGEEMLTS